MLIKITERCERGCSHCMINCKAEGKDMSLETFKTTVDKLQALNISISGGEPMLHPDVIEMIDYACMSGVFTVTVLTAGIALHKLKPLLKKHRKLMVQITNDPRFYPKSSAIDAGIARFVRETNKRQVALVNSIGSISELGRAKGKYKGTRKAAPCLNLVMVMVQEMIRRNTTLRLYDIEVKLASMGLFCSMSIEVDGDLYCGECGLIKIADMKDDNWWYQALDNMMNYETRMECSECGFNNLDSVDKVFPMFRDLIIQYKETYSEQAKKK